MMDSAYERAHSDTSSASLQTAEAEPDIMIEPGEAAIVPIVTAAGMEARAEASTAEDLRSLLTACPNALHHFDHHHAPGSWLQWFDIANQLHMHDFLVEAAQFYTMCFDYGHPYPQDPLAASLLCKVKAGIDPSEEEIAALGRIDDSHMAFIRGARDMMIGGASPAQVLHRMGNAFESFHTGVEADCFFLRAAAQYFAPPEIGVASPNPFGNYDRQRVERIPQRLHFYWNANPPPEVEENFRFHRALGYFDVQVYNKQRAEAFIYDYYGREAKATFTKLRHPAEEADFFRAHVMYAFGGHYIDADLRIRSLEIFRSLIPLTLDAVFLVTAGSLVHNDYFCVEPQSPVMASCIETIMSNCAHYPNLSIDIKTGPGAFTRGLNRVFFRSLAFNTPCPQIRILGQATFDAAFECYDVSYKSDGRHWSFM
jgi:hypothetical protein